MARRKSNILTPWQELEEQAYHAYREWPLFLKLRLRHLRTHLPRALFEWETASSEAILPSSESPNEPEQVAADIALLREYGLFIPEGGVDG